MLFHVTADTRWSNLPLSGAFVDMLKRIVALAGSTADCRRRRASAHAQPRDRSCRRRACSTASALSRPPPPTARPVPADYTGRATADHPPGFYGPPEGLLAVNTLAPADRPTPLDVSPLNARLEAYRHGEPHDLRGPIFLAALALLLLDALVVFWLAGGIWRLRPRRRRGGALLIACAVTRLGAARSGAGATPASRRRRCQRSQQDFAMKATLETHLAYVITGDTEIDAVSKAGLQGLTLFLAQRTALEAGEPVGVDPARDELAFFPLIYWPIVPGAPKPSQAALDAHRRLHEAGRHGAVRHPRRRDGAARPRRRERAAPGMVALRTILSSLDIPELEPVPRDHVLTKTFFLLRDFPGRFTTGQLWVEALPADDERRAESRPARGGDGVSSIIITSNDLAGAWAMRPDGQPMLPMVPGEPRQREFAFRAGVNIVMYTLTGNYKADQVHIPALLERLGQ